MLDVSPLPLPSCMIMASGEVEGGRSVAQFSGPGTEIPTLLEELLEPPTMILYHHYHKIEISRDLSFRCFKSIYYSAASSIVGITSTYRPLSGTIITP